MVAGWFIILIAAGYIGLLFAIAYYGDKRADQGRSLIEFERRLCALDRRLLHVLDLLRQRRPGVAERHRLPADLSGADPRLLPGLAAAAQDPAGQQGQPHHHHRRLHRLALRQERRAGRPGRHHRRHRRGALYRAAAQGRLHELHGAAALSGRRRHGRRRTETPTSTTPPSGRRSAWPPSRSCSAPAPSRRASITRAWSRPSPSNRSSS